MIDLLLLHLAKYDHIFKVNEGELPFNVGQDHIHGKLEYAGCIAESE